MAVYHKIALEINGAKYPIKTTEEPAYVRELAKQLDDTVRQLMAQNSRLSVNESFVLAAMSYLDSYRKAEKGADHLRSQITEYLEESAKARLEATEAKREIARLESQLSAKGSRY